MQPMFIAMMATLAMAAAACATAPEETDGVMSMTVPADQTDEAIEELQSRGASWTARCMKPCDVQDNGNGTVTVTFFPCY